MAGTGLSGPCCLCPLHAAHVPFLRAAIGVARAVRGWSPSSAGCTVFLPKLRLTHGQAARPHTPQKVAQRSDPGGGGGAGAGRGRSRALGAGFRVTWLSSGWRLGTRRAWQCWGARGQQPPQGQGQAGKLRGGGGAAGAAGLEGAGGPPAASDPAPPSSLPSPPDGGCTPVSWSEVRGHREGV